MARTIEVSATQVNAARLLAKQATARGESVPPAVAAMANATPLAPGRSAAAPQVADQPANSTTNSRVNGHASVTEKSTMRANGHDTSVPVDKTAARPTRPRFAG